ncbi:MAG TPA: hypothetical protein VGO47_11925 [Chlamydiales bacterium]|nr:hypothetical protein [Chlamydiales bacterium]
MLVPLLTASINGYDSSVVNGKCASVGILIGHAYIPNSSSSSQAYSCWKNGKSFSTIHKERPLVSILFFPNPSSLSHTSAGFVNAAQNLGSLIVCLSMKLPLLV